jgi:hypothetical protein
MALRSFRYIGQTAQTIAGSLRQPNVVFGPVDDADPSVSALLPTGQLLEEFPRPTGTPPVNVIYDMSIKFQSKTSGTMS